MKGIYTELSALIRMLESKDKKVIDSAYIARQIQNIINFDKALTLEELKDAYAKAAASNALYQNGYKSVVHGEGLFVKVATNNDKHKLRHIYNNAKGLKDQKAFALEEILKRLHEVEGCEGQLRFDENGKIEENKTIAELIEQLREEAKIIPAEEEEKA